jgi:hypothetical protein
MLRAKLDQVRLVHHTIDARSRVSDALQTAVLNSMRDAATSLPCMRDAVSRFGETVNAANSLHLGLASTLTAELIGKLDSTSALLNAACLESVLFGEADLDAAMHEKIERLASLAVTSAELHVETTAVLLELADGEIEHLRGALVGIQSQSRSGYVK